jgi:MtN3 and saliva related transmembrane protein
MAVGLLAGSLTTISLLPQLHKIWCTKSAKDVSIAMFLVMTTGIVLWLTYGILKSDAAIIITNAASLLLAIAILVLMIRYRA